MISRVCLQIEAVERLVHQQQRLRRQQRQRQHEPAAIAFRQCDDALAQDRREPERARSVPATSLSGLPYTAAKNSITRATYWSSHGRSPSGR